MARTIPGYPDPRNLVTLPTQRVTWKGQPVEASEVSVRRSLGAGLPSTVAGVDDLAAATGSVTWKVGKDLVSEGLTLPWLNPAVPVKGDPVNVDLGLGGVLARNLTGVVDVPSGDVVDGHVSASLVDYIDRFKRAFTMDPVYWRHPSPIPGADLMDPGMHPAFVTDRILRRCGFYATPPRVAGDFFSAPMMGSLWPERGIMEFGRSHENRPGTIRDTQPDFVQTSFGMGLLSGSARYRPNTSAAVYNKPMYIRWMTGPVQGTGAVRIRVEFTNGASLAIWQGASARQVSVIMYNTDGSLYGERYFVLPEDVVTSPENEFSVWINSSSAAVTIRGNEATWVGSFPTNTAQNSAVAMTHVQVDTNVMWCAGITAGLTAQVDLHDWERTAILEMSNEGDQQLIEVPTIIEEDSLSLLKSQARAELSGLWLDQEGRFRYRSRDKLMGAAPSWELTLDDVRGIQWDGGGQAEQAVVKWTRPDTSVSNRPWIPAWESSSVTIRPDDAEPVWQTIAHPDGDTDWINIAPLGVLDDPTDERDFNRGIGSWIAGVIESDTEGVGPVSAATYLHAYASLTRLDARSYQIEVDGRYLAPGTQLVLNTADWSGLRESKRGASTPVLRAYAVVEKVEEVATGLPLGKKDAGTYEHDSSWWIQNPQFAQRIADNLAQDLTRALPTIQDLDVTPDDRRELGDVCLLHLPGMTLRCLCVGIEDNYTQNARTQTLALQVIDIEEAN